MKWDGYRALGRRDGATFALCSRNGLDLAPRFPEIAGILSRLPRQVLVDGEIVAVDRHGRASFSALQTRMPGPRGVRSSRAWDASRHSVQYMIFDVLHHHGRSTRGLPYAERRSLLESLITPGPTWQVPAVHRDGTRLLARMRRDGGEGIIAKRWTSTYTPGQRSPDWIKVKLSQQEEFIVVGYWSGGATIAGSLLLAAYGTTADARAGRNLRYCGKVGSGFDGEGRQLLATALKRMRVTTPPCGGALPRSRDITWCRPVLVAQIRFGEWTHDGALRHPVFLGLRSDKVPEEVIHSETLMKVLP